MKATKLLSLIVAATAMCTSTSCMKSDNDDITVVQSLSSYFNVYTRGNDQVIIPGVGYNIIYNYTQTYATISISGLKVPEQSNAYPTLTLPNIEFKQDQIGWKRISVPQVTAANSALVNVATLLNFNFSVADRYVQDYYSPAVNISYNIDGWQVNSFPSNYLAQGSTVVSTDEGQYKPEPEQEAIYSITYDPEKKTCDISIVGAQFAQNMPAQNMRFKAIPFEPEAYSLIASHKDPFVPMLVGSTGAETPQDKFPISNLMCIYNAATGLYVKFDCTIGPTVYHVVMNDTYPVAGSGF